MHQAAITIKMDTCNLDSTFFQVKKLMSLSLFVTVFILGIIAAACIVLRRRRMRVYVWHPTLYPTEECAKVRGVLVMSTRCSLKFSPDANTLPVQQRSTDKGKLVF